MIILSDWARVFPPQRVNRKWFNAKVIIRSSFRTVDGGVGWALSLIILLEGHPCTHFDNIKVPLSFLMTR